VETRNETSAGGVAVRANGGSFDVALIKTHEGRWQLPKGWIEDGESPEEAALREAREEAGVATELVAPLDTIRYQFVSKYDPEPVRVFKRVHFFLLRYLSGSTDDHDHEVLDARWVQIDEAQTLLAFKDERRMIELARARLVEPQPASP
jgi:8-oxo-dGTP pyrophosphatase MutT (NUDIX family)